MKNAMTHKGYSARIEFDAEDRIFFGCIVGIRDIITFHGETVDELEKAFKEAVDDYLELCREEGIEPEKPFRGTFNVRTGSDLHRRASLYAKERGTNLNKVVREALQNYLSVD